MSDGKYSIDDILREVETHRGSDDDGKKPSFDGSVTDIIGGSEIDRAVRTGIQKKRADDGEKPDISVTAVINSIAAKKNKEPIKSSRTARQRTDEEVGRRVANDISEAIGKNVKKVPEEKPVLSAKQLTEEEVGERIAKEISEAADIKIWECLREEDTDMDEEGVREYTPRNAEEEYSDDDDIVPQDPESFVTTNTAQMRKLSKIEEINQALLKVDSESDDTLSSLNPMETRARATEQIKLDDENTDTLAVGGNDLKRIASRGDEKIKEYRPSATRKKDPENKADEVLFSATGVQRAAFPGGLHVGESIVDALNKKIREEKEEAQKAEEDAAPADETENTQSGKINVIASAPEETEEPEDERAAEIKQASELARKKKRRIANFILEDTGSDTDELERAQLYEGEDDEDDEDEVEEPVDLDDENVIRDRLSRAAKGLASRFFILLLLFAATMFVVAVNHFDLKLGSISNIVSYRVNPENFLYALLTIGILSFAACSSVISNGFSRLIKLRPDGDTLCALAHVTAIVAMVPYLAAGEYIQRGRSHVYLAVSLMALIFNTLSKLFTVRTAQKNFAFTSADRPKFFAERCEGDGAETLAKGAVSGIPAVASMRKTELLCDFILSTYCEDISDRFSRKLTPITIAAAVIGSVMAYFTCGNNITMNRVSWAATVCTAIFALGASFSGSLVVTLPLLSAARKSKERDSVILGYNAVEELCDVNAVLTDATALFPPASIKINNICGYDKPKSRCEGKINIDEAIIYAASLAVASNSVLADAFFNMLNYKQELLKPVSGCVYENNLGVMGWIDRRRVLLGNRKHMTSHEITVPNTKKEEAANVNNDEVIYLAVGGEVCLLFFVQLSVDPEIKASVQELAYRDISVIVKTVDGMITSPMITELFEIDEENVRILPFEAHDTFNENTKFVSSGSAAISCGGTFPSLAHAITTTRGIHARSVLGCVVQGAEVGLGILLAIIFMLFVKSNEEIYGIFNVVNILIYNLACAVITLGIQYFRRLQ